MSDFNAFFPLLEFRKRKSRSHGVKRKRKKKNKRKMRAVRRTTILLKDLSKELKGNGRYSMLSFSVLRVLDTSLINSTIVISHYMMLAALLTRCYTEHVLRTLIDSETNHRRHFIKVYLINRGIHFLDLYSIF